MKYLMLIGRILYSLIFLSSGLAHFTQLSSMSQYASSMGVPLPEIAVILTGIMILLGGFSITLGYKTKIGAILLVTFLIPTTFIMHPFWAFDDPMQFQFQMISFLKNLGLLGGALFLLVFGPGDLSVDNRKG